MSAKIRLGILGCGAITREGHLPAATAHPGIEVAALVDLDSRRADSLRRLHRLRCGVTTDYRSVLPELDAVINALPNFLHAQATLEALRAGVHVLCEKPLAKTAAEAKPCCEAAAERGVILAVGMHRRFHASTRLLPVILKDELLGAVHGYDWEEGAPWDWKAASLFYLDRARAGGGVLIDAGVHLLDNLLQWFGPARIHDYQDDDWGSGVEANCALSLSHSVPHGEIEGRVRLSRTFPLKNRLLILCENGSAEIPSSDPDAVIIHRNIGGRALSMTTRFSPPSPAGPRNPFSEQLDSFVAAIRGEELRTSDGWQALAVLDVVEQCYSQARTMPEPWSEPSPSHPGL